MLPQAGQVDDSQWGTPSNAGPPHPQMQQTTLRGAVDGLAAAQG